MPDTVHVDDAQVLSSIKGRRVLVVEDEYMLAEELREALEIRGAEVMGPVSDVADALEILKQGLAPHTAILDINLQGELVYPVADELRVREIPFIFATGYEPWSIPEAYKDVPRVEKPVDPMQVIAMLGG